MASELKHHEEKNLVCVGRGFAGYRSAGKNVLNFGFYAYKRFRVIQDTQQLMTITQISCYTLIAFIEKYECNIIAMESNYPYISQMQTPTQMGAWK